jgi:cell division protein FtsI (penicillin-binding protein 3)
MRKGGKDQSIQGARYYLISSNVDYNQLLDIRKFPVFKHGRFKGGLIEVQRSTRVKPFKEMASRTIGMDRENAEKIGLEGYFDEALKGQSAKRLYKKLPSKTWIPVYEQENTLLNKGADLITTLNVGVQDVVHQEVMRKLIQTRAEAGVGIVMDVKTGAIKAMTNLSKGKNGVYEEYYNYAVGYKGKYNPGSTFKLATLLALLEDGYVTPESKVDLERGVSYFGKDRMSDSEPHDYRVVDVEKAFVISSNVGIAKVANKYYNKSLESRKQFVNRLRSFGLSHKTGIEIVGESEPLIKDPVTNKEEWSGITIPWMAHGYELELTPLQLLTFYNAIANDGYRVEPYLAKELVKEGEVINLHSEDKLEGPIANEYSVKKMQHMLRKVVLEGTAKNLSKHSVEIAGKTGTSRINYADANPSEKIYNASFAGYFPASEPRYSCIVVIYGVKGIGNIYGSQSAAPVFGAIAEKIMLFEAQKNPEGFDDMVYASGNLPPKVKGFNPDVKQVLEYANVPVDMDAEKRWVEMENKQGKIVMDDLKISRKTVPDVRGMGVRDAVYILENLGMKVRIEGVGRVYKQSIAPNSRNKKGEIIIYLD